MKFTPEEIEVIREAQDYGRRRKAGNKKIHCPFAEADPFNRKTTCKLCYKWMRIPGKYSLDDGGHPCMEIFDETELRSRFWRNPKLDESV